MKKIFLLFLTIIGDLYGVNLHEIAKRAQAHLLIQDPASAAEEAKIGLRIDPNQKLLWELYIASVSETGDEIEMMKAWKKYLQQFPDAIENRKILETMAWGIVHKAYKSSSPQMRAYSLLACYLSQDAKGVEVIARAMTDANVIVRSIAIQLASKFRDAKLCDAILHCLRKEKAWSARIQAINAAGTMKISQAKQLLINLITNSESEPEEKTAAIQSLVYIMDSVSRSELQALAKSNRAELRLLACGLAIHGRMVEDLDLIFDLLYDHCSEVRAGAIQVFGVLRFYSWPNLKKRAEELLLDNNSTVSISSGWFLALQNDLKGFQCLKRWIQDHTKENRILAAAALSATGKEGRVIMLETFHKTSDPYVKLNIAVNLLQQRQAVPEACTFLFDEVTNSNERWMWDEQGVFKAIFPSTLKQAQGLPGLTEAKHQLIKLELLNVLCIFRHPKAQEAIVKFLKKDFWGISSIASALLLTEGDETALDLVRGLLNNAVQKNIRIQAALILALWGRDEQSIELLHQSYPNSPREIKQKIIEGIGKIGATESIPILVEALNEPAQSLRIHAAAALLQCLYH